MTRLILNVCDGHTLNDPTSRVEGDTVSVTLDGKSYDFELCNQCREVFLTPLEALLVRQGRPVRREYVKGPKKQPTVPASPFGMDGSHLDFDCLFCEKHYKNAAGISGHFRSKAHLDKVKSMNRRGRPAYLAPGVDEEVIRKWAKENFLPHMSKRARRDGTVAVPSTTRRLYAEAHGM